MFAVVAVVPLSTAEEASQTTPAAPQALPTVQATPAQTTPEQKVAEANAKLSAAVWNIELTPVSSGSSSKPAKDTLRFEQGKLASDALSSQGYMKSNYTLTVGGDSVPVWETMQANEQVGVVFWRGEIRGDTMRGVLSKHPIQGNTEDFSFVGHQGSMPPMQAMPATAPVVERSVATPAPTTLPAQSARPAALPAPEKPKKKGWFR